GPGRGTGRGADTGAHRSYEATQFRRGGPDSRGTPGGRHRARGSSGRRDAMAPRLIDPNKPQTPPVPENKPAYWDEAVAALVERDRILRRIIPQYPDGWLAPPGAPFVTLARALIGHQSSIKIGRAHV